MATTQIAYGQVAGPVVDMEIPSAASQNFELKSGKFVYLSSGYATRAATGQNYLFGYVLNVGDHTTSSTAGEKLSVNISTDAVYEVPINNAKTEAELIAMLGSTYDIETTSNIQYLDTATQTDNVLMMVGYRYYGSGSGNQTALVRMTPKEIATA